MSDPLDILTLSEAKSILAISDTSTDTELARVITSVSRRLDTYIGPVVRRSVTSETHSGGGSRIELNHGPVYAIASVTEYQGTTARTVTAETAGTEPSEGFYAERYIPNPSLLSGVLIRRVSGHDSCWYWGRGNVQVTYTAGRAETTGAVDPIHKEAAGIMLRNLWRSYQQSTGGFGEFDTPAQNFPTFAIPKAVVELLADEVQPTIGFG